MRYQVIIVLLMILLAPNGYAEPGIPDIGAAVRFQTEELDTGWHRGFFNQLRTVPPCYLVMTFNTRTSPNVSLRVTRAVPIFRVNRLQVSSVPGVSMQAWDGMDLPDIPEQSWHEVDLETLFQEKGRCLNIDWSVVQPPRKIE